MTQRNTLRTIVLRRADEPSARGLRSHGEVCAFMSPTSRPLPSESPSRLQSANRPRPRAVADHGMAPAGRRATLTPAPTATPSGGHGFTLVELLAVVGILALLMALLTPAVFRARASAVNAKVKSEIDMLHMSLMNYKSEYGSFPPADMRGLWNWSANPPQVNKSHPAYKHLVRIFPRMAERAADGPTGGPESPFKYMAQMSPAQALVFWLRGFYPNQEYPLTNGSWPPQGTRKRLFDFEEGRLYAASSYHTPTGTVRQTFALRDPSNSFFEYEYPVYFTSHPDSGLPYVYFDSRCYGTQPDMVYHATSRSGGSTTARPYLTSTRPANATYSQYHVAPETFQLIASGPDGSFGRDETTGTQIPVAFPKDTLLPQGNIFAPQGASIRIPGVTEKTNAPNHDDNITDFAGGPLADAAETLAAR